MLPRESDRLGLLSWLDREGHLDHAVVEVVADLIPGFGEDLDHLAVLWQDISHELGHPPLLADGGQVLQEHRPHSLALMGVGDVKGDLSRRRVQPVIASDPDDLAIHGGHQSHPPVVVDLGETDHVLVAQGLQRCEEAQIDRLGRLPRVEAAKAVGIGGHHRTDVSHGPVPQDDVGLPPQRIGIRADARVGHGFRMSDPPLPGRHLCVSLEVKPRV